MNFSKIQKEANLYRKNPGDHVWQKVENKLDTKIQHTPSLRIPHPLLYAALFIGILIITFVVFPTNNQLTKSTALEFESVEVSPNQQMYSIEKVANLNYAYAKLNMTDISKYRGN